MKKKLIVGTLFSLFSVCAYAQDQPKIGDDWKTAIASDSTFLQFKWVYDSIMFGMMTFKYGKTPKDLEAFWQQQHLSTEHLQQKYESADFKNAQEYEALVNRVPLLRENLYNKYPMFKQLSDAEKFKLLKYAPTEAENRIIKEAERQHFPRKRK